MQRKYFGTDGMRGAANSGVMTADNVLNLGIAAGTVFTRGNHRHRVIIGKDTRLSGYLFENAITAGFLSTGMDVFLVGPMPTPAIAMLVKSMRADLGVMISASHNPYHDNGIKLFGPDGYKLSDQVENQIEQIMHNPAKRNQVNTDKIGRATRIDDAPGRYIEFIKNTFPKGQRLEKFKIVVDCANGAAYHLGGKIFWELGAEIIEIGVTPNGVNINDNCGSNHLSNLTSHVLKHKACLGIALDGDADRILMVDELGQVIDGDLILALIACYLKRYNQLKENAVVTTVMSNMALETYLKTQEIKTYRTQVGDRYVATKMLECGLNLGGEPSGHIIVGDYSTTGDGLVAALQMLALLNEQDKPLSELRKTFTPLPQMIRNIPSNDPKIIENSQLQKAIHSGNLKIQNKGRLVVRKSGTESMIRIMAEGEDYTLLNHVLDDIEAAIK